MRTRNRFARPRPALLACNGIPRGRSTLRCATPAGSETGCGWGHGGTRKRHTSRSAHTWSVKPVAIAGVQGRHPLAEPVPWVGIGAASAWRKLTGGHTKVWEGLHKDSRKNGHSLSKCCNGVVFGLCQLRGHRIGCSRLRQQHSAYKYRYRMGSWPTARIRRALGRIIPPKTARIICESTSIQGLWPLLQESLCNPTIHPQRDLSTMATEAAPTLLALTTALVTSN